MKKTIILAISLIFALNISANEFNTTNAEAFDMKNVNIEKISCSLNASKDQKESIIDVMSLFVNQMECIKTEQSTTSRNKMLDNALKMNIEYMKSILDENQYRRYLSILNSTLVNRGIVQ